jgi:predicted 3-demethylubiquinone-9 3-methyltransferase (glyoxalase superfamily)
MLKISPCLWFDNQAEEAVNFYVSIFKNGKIGKTLHYGEGAPFPAGTILTITFEIDGVSFTALNGGPHFKFNEAVSFVVDCKSQEEVDYYWNRLLEGGIEQQCGWLKDKFGVSWQIVPDAVSRLINDPDSGRAARVMQALMKMVKIDIATLEKAANG